MPERRYDRYLGALRRAWHQPGLWDLRRFLATVGDVPRPADWCPPDTRPEEAAAAEEVERAT